MRGSIVTVLRVKAPQILLPSVICSSLILSVRVGIKSFAVMLTVAMFCEPIAAPLEGLELLRLMASVLSKILSSMKRISTVLLVSPFAKLTVIGLLL